jgi:hypothetical protein
MPTQVEFMIPQMTVTTYGYRVKRGFRVSPGSPYLIMLRISRLSLVLLLFLDPMLITIQVIFKLINTHFF